jgi:hypothetical protein
MFFMPTAESSPQCVFIYDDINLNMKWVVFFIEMVFADLRLHHICLFTTLNPTNTEIILSLRGGILG